MNLKIAIVAWLCACNLAVLQGQSFIQQAIANHDLKEINRWIKSTENIDAPFTLGDQTYTPLQYACEQADVEVALLLINKGASVTRLTQGQDALMFAAKGGNMEIVETLLEKGANPLNENQLGYSARDLAKLAGHAEVANFLENEIKSRLSANRKKLK